MYIPKNRIKTNLYTPGNEFIFKSDETNYIGHYYSLYTGKFFTFTLLQNQKPILIFRLESLFDKKLGFLDQK